MDIMAEHGYRIYQLRTEMWGLFVADWKVDVMTVKYWGIVAFILIYYAVWWKLTDKRRVSDLIIFGSFLAVMSVIIDLFGVTAGLWVYKVRLTPMPASIFMHALTLTPLTFMLALQYSPNWKQFMVWAAVASAWIHFVVLPITSLFEIYQPMKWNYVYGFLVYYGAAILARGAFHLVKQVQQKAVEGYDSPLQSTLMQPAFKPLSEDKEDEE